MPVTKFPFIVGAAAPRAFPSNTMARLCRETHPTLGQAAWAVKVVLTHAGPVPHAAAAVPAVAAGQRAVQAVHARGAYQAVLTERRVIPGSAAFQAQAVLRAARRSAPTVPTGHLTVRPVHVFWTWLLTELTQTTIPAAFGTFTSLSITSLSKKITEKQHCPYFQEHSIFLKRTDINYMQPLRSHDIRVRIKIDALQKIN